MRYFRFLLILLVASTAYPPPIVQAKLPPEVIDFDHLTMKDGLSNPVIYDFVKDRQGFVWFATGNGVSRYNGYEITNYLPDERDANTIGRGPVLKLFVDSRQRLWAVVHGAGLFRYDEKRDHFISFKNTADNPSGLPSNSVYSLVEDKDGIFWISTLDAGLTAFNESSGTFQHYRHTPGSRTGLPSDKLSALLMDRDNTLWISTLDKGYVRYDLKTKEFTRHLEDYPHAVGMTEDRHGDLWIPTLGKGVVRYIRSENRFQIYGHADNDPRSISHNQVVRVAEDTHGVIWLTTWGGGVNIFDRNGQRFVRHTNAPDRPESLNNNNTWGLYTDDTGMVWIGTYGAGINTYDRKSERFQWLRHAPSDPNSLPANSVKAVFEDSRKLLWFGTLGGGLSKYNPQTNTYTNYLNDPKNPDSISHNNIWMISEDRSGDLWIATDDGLNKYEQATGRFLRYHHRPDTPDGPSSNIIRSVLVDRENNVWIGTQNRGIDRFDPRQNRFENYAVKGGHNTILYQDRIGRIWSGNAQSIHIFDHEKNTFNPVTIRSNGSDHTLDGFFTALKEDHHGRIWIGMVGGLMLIQPDGIYLNRFGIDQGLNDEAVSDIQFDQNGGVWVSTARGLSVLDLKNNRFRNYELGFYNRGASLIDVNGRFFFGGLRGVTHFMAENITESPHIPPIVITNFKISNRSRNPNNLIDENDYISLTHQDRLFSFEFAALDLSNPDKNRYKYMLEGFDTQWIEASSKLRIATYTNLDAGEYIFRVIGSNSDAVWNQEGITVKLKVLPPWWKSWWFRTLSALIAIGTILYVFQSKTNQLKNEMQVSQQLREGEEKLRLIFENSPLGMIHFDRHGLVTACNGTVCKIFDQSRDTVIGHHISGLFTSEEIRTALSHTLSGETYRHDNANISIKEEKAIPTRTMFGPIRSIDGEVTGGIGIFEDISAQINAEQETAALEAKLQHALKLEAIGTLAGGIAHDFNNILSVIIGYTELVLYNPKQKTPHAKELKEIKKAGIRAKDLVQQILAFSRQDKTELLLLRPSLIVKESIKMLRPTLPATITINANVESDTSLIMANPTQIHQILINLCTNSCHAMEDQVGDLDIKLQEIELDENDLRQEPDVSPGDFVALSVGDSGHGIPEEILERIFEPYFTTKKEGQGTGMGLSIIHGIVKSYGGFVDIHSKTGEGTQCHVYFPAHTGQSTQASGETIVIPEGDERILLVDDEKAIVDMEKNLLERLGYTVTTTYGSIEALEIFQASPHDYDIVITDHTMPNMTGADLAKKILEIRPDMPIIMCTGYSSRITEKKVESLGIKALAMKPLIIQDIATLIRNVIDA